MLWLMSYIIQKDIAIPKWMVWSPIELDPGGWTGIVTC